ncbi:MAG TPA: hypothetical protein DCS66_08320, partial [Flavobacteriaceae bacterium]|nr:hypothetical protein [Flavobacteriaceae bacterium]
MNTRIENARTATDRTSETRQETEKYVLDLMFAEEGPVMTFLEPFISEPLGFDRFIDVTTRNG